MTLLMTPTPIPSLVKTSLNCHPGKWSVPLSRWGRLPGTLPKRRGRILVFCKAGIKWEVVSPGRFSCILNDERSKLEMLLKHNPTWDYKSVLSIIKGWMSAIFIILLPFSLNFSEDLAVYVPFKQD